MAINYTPEEITEILNDYFSGITHKQYIGARYVPIFGRKGEDSIEWDNTGTYEPLTIVLYQGNSFTSRQYVPIGIDINNQAYWAETGNYNAQVEQYRREVMRISDALPIDEFDEEHTVKDYVDNFFDVETRNAVDISIDTDDESNSVYILAKIKREQATPFFAYNTTDYADTTVFDYVKTLDRAILSACCLHGPTVYNDSILTQGPILSDYYFMIFGFDENNDPKWEVDATRTKTAQDLISSGYKIGFPAWFPLVTNNAKFNISSIDDDSDRFDTLVNYKHTRTMFGYDDDYFYIVIIEGRLVFSPGATVDEAANLGIRLGIKNLFNFDGGGSSQLWTSGNVAFNGIFPAQESKNSYMISRKVLGLLGMEI